MSLWPPKIDLTRSAKQGGWTHLNVGVAWNQEKPISNLTASQSTLDLGFSASNNVIQLGGERLVVFFGETVWFHTVDYLTAIQTAYGSFASFLFSFVNFPDDDTASAALGSNANTITWHSFTVLCGRPVLIFEGSFGFESMSASP